MEGPMLPLWAPIGKGDPFVNNNEKLSTSKH